MMGLISSIFDGMTFAALIFLFHAEKSFFRTGWFLESLVTQILIILSLRTRRHCLCQSTRTISPCARCQYNCGSRCPFLSAQSRRVAWIRTFFRALLSSTMSLGTTCATDRLDLTPSRQTLARKSICPRSASMTAWALASCTKSSSTESRTIMAIVAKLARSPVAAESALASSRMMTSGFPRGFASRNQAGDCFAALASFRPYWCSRFSASTVVRPVEAKP